MLHAGLFRPQLRISRALCAVLHRKWRRAAEPSVTGAPAEGEGCRGEGRRGAGRDPWHRQGRHGRAQRRGLCHRAGGAAVGRLLLHARDSAEHRRRLHRRGDPRGVGRGGTGGGTDTEIFDAGDPALCFPQGGARGVGCRRGRRTQDRRCERSDRDRQAGRHHSGGWRQAAICRDGAHQRAVPRGGAQGGERCAGVLADRDAMNAPLTERDLLATAGTLQVYALFHLNLAFSSIEEEQRATVIEKCYWPLLRLADRFGPIGIEATGYTLEEIAVRDPEWIGRARALLARGRIELVGSGYSQMLGPLVPARVAEANLKIGNDVYQRLLGVTPAVALVNEQAYSAGLVGLYLDAGYRALAMDWDNPGAAHPQWAGVARSLRQRALGADGRAIGLIWTNTVAFQKMQRFVHRDIEIDSYLEYVRGHRAASRRALCVYASDAEIFDYRPGRYKTEEKCAGDEWSRMEDAFERRTGEFELVAPSDVLALRDTPDAGQVLRLETAAMPIPVKKQRKYNLARWAGTGRDDLCVFAACERIYRGMNAGKATAADWKELCWLWASDFRTHATDTRWAKVTARLSAAEAKWSIAPSPAPVASGDVIECRQIDIATPFVAARLDRRRGLALATVQFANHAMPALGGLTHGHFVVFV